MFVVALQSRMKLLDTSCVGSIGVSGVQRQLRHTWPYSAGLSWPRSYVVKVAALAGALTTNRQDRPTGFCSARPQLMAILQRRGRRRTKMRPIERKKWRAWWLMRQQNARIWRGLRQEIRWLSGTGIHSAVIAGCAAVALTFSDHLCCNPVFVDRSQAAQPSNRLPNVKSRYDSLYGRFHAFRMLSVIVLRLKTGILTPSVFIHSERW